MIVAFRSAKVASLSGSFAEQKATVFVAPPINSQPIRETDILRALWSARAIVGANIL